MNYYNEIKKKLINNEVYKKVKDYSKNKSDLTTYYNVGKLIVEAQGGEKRAKYCDNLIKEYSEKLTMELGKNYSERNLRNMRQFYLILRKQNWQTMSAKLTWSHYVEIIWLKDVDKINYYIKISSIQSLSVRELRNRIKSNEYERLDETTKQKLIKKDNKFVMEYCSDSRIFRATYILN